MVKKFDYSIVYYIKVLILSNYLIMSFNFRSRKSYMPTCVPLLLRIALLSIDPTITDFQEVGCLHSLCSSNRSVAQRLERLATVLGRSSFSADASAHALSLQCRKWDSCPYSNKEWIKLNAISNRLHDSMARVLCAIQHPYPR